MPDSSRDAARFLDCVGRRCEDYRPLCTRGLIYGDPDLPKELKAARRNHPLFKPYLVKSVSGPFKRSWGWSYEVRLAAGSAQGLKIDDRFYWDHPHEWVALKKVGETSSIGEIQTAERDGPVIRPALLPGMTVSGWTLSTWARPHFLFRFAEVKHR